jgi:hypothetical protein
LKVTAVIGAVGPEAWTFVPPNPPVKLAIKLDDRIPFSASRSACQKHARARSKTRTDRSDIGVESG